MGTYFQSMYRFFVYFHATKGFRFFNSLRYVSLFHCMFIVWSNPDGKLACKFYSPNESRFPLISLFSTHVNIYHHVLPDIRRFSRFPDVNAMASFSRIFKDDDNKFFVEINVFLGGSWFLEQSTVWWNSIDNVLFSSFIHLSSIFVG